MNYNAWVSDKDCSEWSEQDTNVINFKDISMKELTPLIELTAKQGMFILIGQNNAVGVDGYYVQH